MQLLSATLQLFNSFVTCSTSINAGGQHVAHCAYDAVATWFTSIFTADLFLFCTFCAGFLIFRSLTIQGWIATVLGGPFQPSSIDKIPDTGRNADGGSVQSATSCAFSSYEIEQRPRCPALRAQTGGQPPELGQASTTVILSHIPRSCTPDALLASLHDNGYFGEIDFVYVPIDFKRGDCSLGFALLNFRLSNVCLQFATEFHMAQVSDLLVDADTTKLLEVAPAKIQGAQENIRHLQKSRVLTWLTPYAVWLPRLIDAGGLAVPLKATSGSARSRNSAHRKTKPTGDQRRAEKFPTFLLPRKGAS